MLYDTSIGHDFTGRHETELLGEPRHATAFAKHWTEVYITSNQSRSSTPVGTAVKSLHAAAEPRLNRCFIPCEIPYRLAFPSCCCEAKVAAYADSEAYFP